MALRVAPFIVLASVLSIGGLQCARADIYTWVDASGTTNISNLAPPEGAHVTGVVKSSPLKPANSDAERDAEVRALAERVRQLQDDVEAARQPPPAPLAYQYSAPPPPMQYAAAPMPPPMQYYDSEAAPGQGATCDPGFQYCGAGWGFGGIPAVIVVAAPRARHFHAFRGPPHAVRGPPRGSVPRPGPMQVAARRR